MLAPRSKDILRILLENGWLLGDLDTALRWHERLVALPDVSAWDETFYPAARMQVLGDPALMQTRLVHVLAVPANARDSFLRLAQFNAHYLAGEFRAAEESLKAVPEEIYEDQSALTPVSLLRARVAGARGQAQAAGQHATAAWLGSIASWQSTRTIIAP